MEFNSIVWLKLLSVEKSLSPEYLITEQHLMFPALSLPPYLGIRLRRVKSLRL